MKPKPPPWWQLPSIIVASVGALGTAAVVVARYITLPTRVEAGEQKNVQQDKQIDRLITLQEYYANQQQQAPNQLSRPQALPPAPQPIPPTTPKPPTLKVEWAQDEDGNWFCTNGQESWWPNERGECD